MFLIVVAFLTACAIAWAMGRVPGRSHEFKPQKPAERKEHKSGFGSAADLNLTFTTETAAHDGDGPKGKSRSYYMMLKWTSYLMDYAYLILAFGAYNHTFSESNWSPAVAAKLVVINTSILISMDFLKVAFFADAFAEVKVNHLRALRKELFEICFTFAGIKKAFGFLGRVFLSGEGIWREFSDKHEARYGVLYHLFYVFKNVVMFAPMAVYLQTQAGIFTFEDIYTQVGVIFQGTRLETKVSKMMIIYLEFLFMSFIKDALSMNVFHQIMHTQWYSMHKTHHMPMKELSLANAFFFDIPDLIVENIIAPVVLITMKATMSPSCAGSTSLHFLSFLLLATTDINIHSICPYAIGFFNPLLDLIMMPNISHQLHHSLNTGHYTVWPWHQLKGVSHYDSKQQANVDGSVQRDLNSYNKVFGTRFPA